MVGRTGLVQISSMTAVLHAPRADRMEASATAGDPPWQTHLMYVCQHKTTQPRLKRYERGGIRALLQCLECGQKASNFIATAGVTEAWDTDLEQRVMLDYESAKQKWDQARKVAWESAEKLANRSWWEAYDSYLRTAVWAVKRELVLERCGGVCEACGQRRAVHVHHKKYPDVFGLEPLFDLAAVCVPCHKIIHPHME